MTAPADGSSNPRILVADDDPVNRRLCSLILGRSGYESMVVADGLDVLEVLARERFDLVLLDVSMPGLDGPETARRIRRGDAGEEAAALTILAVTGFSGSDDHRACLDAGMDGVLVKPLSLKALEPWLAGRAPGGASA